MAQHCLHIERNGRFFCKRFYHFGIKIAVNKTRQMIDARIESGQLRRIEGIAF